MTTFHWLEGSEMLRKVTLMLKAKVDSSNNKAIHNDLKKVTKSSKHSKVIEIKINWLLDQAHRFKKQLTFFIELYYIMDLFYFFTLQ